MENKKREAGVLLPISALPSAHGIGCFSSDAYKFVDFLADAGQSVWQILPLCPTSFGNSPYQSPSSFAGNPYFIDPAGLVRDGLVTDDECSGFDCEGENFRVDYARLYEMRYGLLRLAHGRFAERERPDGYASFLAENGSWLEDYAMFMAIKSEQRGAPLSSWPRPLRLREPTSLAECRARLSREIDFWKFLQYRFFLEWRALKRYANGKGIRIMGDIPIYVSADSVDMWVSPELFLLDRDGEPLEVAGCPPDSFSPRGQLWGNPLYRWEEHRARGYSWWISRISFAFSMYDIVRIDHFRGFDCYYSVPFGAPDAVGGRWERGAGVELFLAVKRSLGERDIVAEDLGYITESVRRLVRDCGFSGMKVLQFGFDGGDMDFSSEYLPHTYNAQSVAYTGTHDNPTLAEWLSSLSEDSERMLRKYFCDYVTPLEDFSPKMISALMQSPSELCIVPMQDYLGVGREGRMNTPSVSQGNWEWRMRYEDMSCEVARRIRELCEIGGRSAKV